MNARIPGYQMTAVAVVIYCVGPVAQGVWGIFLKKRMVAHEEESSSKQMTCLTVAQKTEFCV